MKTIAVHIEKGGVGKTTTAVNLAFEFSRFGKTVLVDADPQGNSTSWLVPSGTAMDFDLCDLLEGKAKVAQVVQKVRENLFVLPTFAVGGTLRLWSETQLNQKPLVFTKLVRELEASGTEFVVFDMSPGIATLEKRILAVVDEVIGVMRAESFSFDGLEIFEHELTTLREDFGASFEVNKLVVNQVMPNFKVHKLYMGQMETLKYKLYTVHSSVKISEAVPAQKALREYEPSHPAVSTYATLAKDVASRQMSLLGV